MKHNLFLSMLAAALMGSGVANAEILHASDYRYGPIVLCDGGSVYDKLVVNKPLTLTDEEGTLTLGNGASIEFQKNKEANSICSICTSENMLSMYQSVTFKVSNDFTFDADAQAFIAASAGTPITLIQDLNMQCKGFEFQPTTTTLKLNGVEYGETVVLDGVSFTYVGPQSSDYTFQKGEIGFKGYAEGSHALILEHGGGIPTPEPATGTLSLLALAALSARRRKK